MLFYEEFANVNPNKGLEGFSDRTQAVDYMYAVDRFIRIQYDMEHKNVEMLIEHTRRTLVRYQDNMLNLEAYLVQAKTAKRVFTPVVIDTFFSEVERKEGHDKRREKLLATKALIESQLACINAQMIKEG